MKKSSLFLTGAGVIAFALLAQVGVLHAQSMASSTGGILPPLPPPPPPTSQLPPTSTSPLVLPPTSTQPLLPPEPTLFSSTGTNEWHPTSTDMLLEHPTSTRPMMQDMTDRPSSTRPMMPPSMMGGVNPDENVVVSPDDTAAVRAAKLARYWSLYREVGSNSIFAITTSGTKREIQTLDFFTGVDANFGIKLMPKGSLDQFTTADPITSIEGLDPSQFRKAPQPCRLIKTADMPAVYLACLGVKRVILNERAFHQFGWNFNQVKTVAPTELNSMKAGDNVDESTVFDQGVTIDASGANAGASTGSQPSQPKPSTVQPQSTGKVSGLTTTKGIKIVKVQGSTKIYIIASDGQSHLITDMDVVRALKLNLSKVQTITQDQLNAYTAGTPITYTPAASSTASMHPPTRPYAPGMGSSTSMMSPPNAPTSSTSQKPIAYLVKASGGDGTIYLITPDKMKHRILSTMGLGDQYTIMPLREITADQLAAIPEGAAIGTASTTPPVLPTPPSTTMPLNPESTSSNGDQTGTDLSPTTTPPTMPSTY